MLSQLLHEGCLQSEIFQIQQRLSLQLYPRQLSEFASSAHCRIHDTTAHDELNCLTFLSRVELALQGQIFFWDVPKPEATVQSDIPSPPSSIEEFTRFKNLIENQFGLEEELCLEDVLSPWWCRIHRAPHSEFTCSLCIEAVSQVKAQFGLPEEPEESITSKVWSAYLAADEYRRMQNPCSAALPDDERMELPIAKQDEPVNQTKAANEFVIPATDEHSVQEDDQGSFVDQPQVEEQFFTLLEASIDFKKTTLFLQATKKLMMVRFLLYAHQSKRIV